MIRRRVLVEIGAVNNAVSLEMSLIKNNIVFLSAIISNDDKVEAIVSWSDLWNSLFLPKGNAKNFRHSNLNSIAHIMNKDLHLYFKPVQSGDLIVIRWRDFREALFAIKKKV